MRKSHAGSSFESWLEEEGILESATAKALKSVIARQLARENGGAADFEEADG